MKVTVDLVIFTIQSEKLKVLLVKRGIPPFKGQFALPGGFVHEGESLEDAAVRELREETGIADVYLEQLYSFGEPGRDPRERVITIAYYALISADRSALAAGTDAAEAAWWPVGKLPALAFDHQEIFDKCIQQLQKRVQEHPLGFNLLPKKFSLRELQNLYEAILDIKMDRRNFRKKFFSMDFLIDLKEMEQNVPHRPGKLYKFNYEKYEKRKKKLSGIDF